MKNRFVLLMALLFAGPASADPKTLSAVCAVNTYNLDGSNFKALISSTFDLGLSARTEIFRTSEAVYSVFPQEQILVDNKTYTSFYLEIKDARTGESIASASNRWIKDSTGDHALVLYTTKAEKGVKTMFLCN